MIDTVAWVAVLVNALVGLLVARYTQATQATLRVLQQEHRSKYDAHVKAVGWTRLGGIGLNQVLGVEVELLNLGPGPAEQVGVEAFCRDTNGQALYLVGTFVGIMPGERALVSLEPTAVPANFPTDLPNDRARIQVMAGTVLGDAMAVRQYEFSYPPPAKTFI